MLTTTLSIDVRTCSVVFVRKNKFYFAKSLGSLASVAVGSMICDGRHVYFL
jgi:hypothetical protein